MSYLANWKFEEISYKDQKVYKEADINQAFTYCPEYLKKKPFFERLDYNNIFFILLTHLLTVLVFLYAEFKAPTVIFAIIYYHLTCMGITAGYHRMYSHKAYEGNGLYQVIVLLIGAGALQGSCLYWSILHRAHHRWTDTEKDPYNSKRGFFYAHIGWLFYKTERINTNVLFVEDLKKNPYVRWQNNWFRLLGPFMGLGFPALVCSLWGDTKGGFLIAGVMRAVLCQESTWCINSFAHFSLTGIFNFLASKPYDNTLTPVDNVICALITSGEGYHNFHHEYPNDYRNAIFWYQYDPTKWLIKVCSYIGLTKNLNTFPNQEIQRAIIDMEQKELDERKKKINYGVHPESLPIMTADDITE